MEYRVVWAIDVDAESEEDAARRACEIMKRRYDESIAHSFQVMPTDLAGASHWPDHVVAVTVDLDEIDGKGDL